MGNQTRGVGTARPQRRVKEGIVMAKDVNLESVVTLQDPFQLLTAVSS